LIGQFLTLIPHPLLLLPL